MAIAPAYVMDGVSFHTALYALTKFGEIYLQDEKGWRRMFNLAEIKSELDNA